MGIAVHIEGHGQGEIVSTDGKRVVLVSPSSAPPGASLSLALGGMPRPCRVKVSSCKRAVDSREPVFRIEGRFVDLTRDERARLERDGHGGSS